MAQKYWDNMMHIKRKRRLLLVATALSFYLTLKVMLLDGLSTYVPSFQRIQQKEVFHTFVTGDKRWHSEQDTTEQVLTAKYVRTTPLVQMPMFEFDFVRQRNGTVFIPGGGMLPFPGPSHNMTVYKMKWGNKYPHDLVGVHLQPDLLFPKDPEVYYRRWPLRLTNIDYKFIVHPKSPCRGETSLVIIVHTRADYFSSRKIIRTTWSSVTGNQGKGIWPTNNQTYEDFEVYFSLGIHLSKPDLTEKILEEAHEFDDIILGDYHDSYHNLTLKSLMDLKWMVGYCPNAKLLMKMDDDMFIDIPSIANLTQIYKNTTRFIGGNTQGGAVKRHIGHKWSVPKERFPFDNFPQYVPGAAYLMSNDLSAPMLDLAEHVPPIHIDDAFLTGILRMILKFKLVKIPCLVLGIKASGLKVILEQKKCITPGVRLGQEKREMLWKQLHDKSSDVKDINDVIV